MQRFQARNLRGCPGIIVHYTTSNYTLRHWTAKIRLMMNSHISFTLTTATLLLSIFGVFAAQTSRETCQASSHALTDFASSHQFIAPTVTWHHTVLCIALTCCLASYKHAYSLSNNLTCWFSCYAPSSYLRDLVKRGINLTLIEC